ncbi:branched-chain amino acid ABC transporter permease [Cupriavidus basilensis]|uniref:branched-chain amino acid ABC transporter permease n=1 Tax=Cupriavidus basilensis TaxID=68895 RepID=UPI0020A6319B|nr:branched-chain amino acid ABC transporter permease [Cupriavidus basilensis]MCP3018322.1 branched-chain amino acid ABC transporter permease [Cupriavidus basilensis]
MNVFDSLRSRAGPRREAIVLASIIAMLPFVLASDFHYRVLAIAWVFALAVIGLNILMGYAGVVSLGHGGFVGIGAYAVALGPARLGIPTGASLVGGLLLAGLLAFVIGRPILRLKGHYLAAATLGFGILVSIALVNEVQWTGGPDGMSVQRLGAFGWQLRSPQAWYWVAGGALVLGAMLAVNLERSPTGRALRAIHGSEIAASVAGVDVARYKLVAFVLSAVYAAAAGAMLALMNAHITPGVSDFLVSLQLVTMVVLGGMGSVLGAVVGTALLLILPQFLTVLHDYEHAFLGGVLILSMIFLRSGIVPTLQAALRKGG